MRLTTSALTAAVLGTALSATTLIAQQNPPDSGLGTSTASIPGMTASRGARYLLRNGWDYLKYQEYERALGFFREAEQRKSELNDSERQALVQGIDNARRGMREAGDGSARRSYAGRGPLRRPGAFALAKSSRPAAPEPVQLTSGSGPAAQPAPAANAGLPPLPDSPGTPNTPEAGLPPLPPAPSSAEVLAMPPAPAIPGPPPTVDPAMTRAEAAPAPLAEPAPAPLSPPATSEPRALAAGPAAAEMPAPAPAPAAAPDLAPLDLDSVPLPPLSGSAPAAPAPAPAPEPTPTPLPATPAQENISALAPPASERLVPVSEPPAPAPEPPAPVETPGAAPALPEPPRVAVVPEGAEPPPSIPTPAASEEPPPPLPAESIPPRAEPIQPRRAASDSFIPERSANGRSTLSPELQREVERIAQKQEDDLRAKGVPARSIPGEMPGEVGGLTASPGLPSPRLEISRAPSPTEARPIRAIPVPDEFVPLAKREWEPQRKYWSSAAVCHMPLYFQDAALERYGESVEQAVGPLGRFLSYPVDDPKQSVQRNQLTQPFASIGLFAAQIALLPYNLIMDPPWEAEYDLGYFRPGDRVPTDTIYLPLTGVGPPLHGKRY